MRPSGDFYEKLSLFPSSVSCNSEKNTEDNLKRALFIKSTKEKTGFETSFPISLELFLSHL